MGGSESKPASLSPMILTRTPWRILKESGATLENTIVADIKKLKPEQSPGILLLGPVGAGKSSFINSCLSVEKRRKVALATTGSAKGSYTLQFKKYDGTEWLQNFRFMDCMGIEGIENQGFHPSDIMFLLQGHVKIGYKFNQEIPLDKESEFYEPNPTFESKTNCVVFVIAAKTMDDGIPDAFVDKIKLLQNKIKNEDIPRMLILTKCDLLCNKVEENTDNIFRSVKVKTAVKTASEVFSIDMASIHPVINYEGDIEPSTAKNIPILLALRQLLQYACDRVEQVRKNSATDIPWRAINDFGATLENAIERDIKLLEPKSSPGILLLGPVGAGKSSFINSCLSVDVGRKKVLAETGSDDASYTSKFQLYKGSKLLKNFRFMDCMGIKGSFGKGCNPHDIPLLLQGHIKKNYEFKPDKTVEKDREHYEPNPKFEDTTHCVVFVIDAKTMYDGIPKDFVDIIKWLQKVIKNAGVSQVIVLTKCDILCSEVKNDTSNIFRSCKIEQAVKAAREVFGIDISSIHPVINYEDVEMSTAYNIPIMLALREILQFACDRVEFLLD